MINNESVVVDTLSSLWECGRDGRRTDGQSAAAAAAEAACVLVVGRFGWLVVGGWWSTANELID